MRSSVDPHSDGVSDAAKVFTATILAGGALSSAKEEMFFSLGGIVTNHAGAALTGSIPDLIVVITVLYVLLELMLRIPGRFGVYREHTR